MKISREQLEELYVKQGLKQREIAEIIGSNQSTVFYNLKKYGFVKAKENKPKENPYPRSGKKWSNEEIELLERLYGVVSYKTICGRLKRSKSSIENKKNELKLGSLIEATDKITSNELARALGRMPYTIRSWIDKKGLPAVKKVLKAERGFYRIDVKDFWKWSKDNPLMDWSKYQIGNLPNEPSWVIEVKKKAVPRKTRSWTELDDTLLIFYYNQGCKLKDIAKKLNRTFKSIDMRLIKLDAKRKAKLIWQPEEVNIMLDMLDEEKTFTEIAEELGRTCKAVSAKYVILKEMSEKMSA